MISSVGLIHREGSSNVTGLLFSLFRVTRYTHPEKHIVEAILERSGIRDIQLQINERRDILKKLMG